MIKLLLMEKNMKISDLSKKSHVPYSTTNDIINGKVEIDRIQVGVLVRLAAACSMSLDEFYKAAKESSNLPVIEEGRILLRNKRFYLEYDIDGEKGTQYIFKANRNTSRYVKEAAEWIIADIKEEIENKKQIEEMNAWQERISI